MMEILVDDDKMLLKVEWYQGIPILHLEVRKWSHNLLKKYFFPQWIKIQDYLKGRGANVVLALVPSGEEKIIKFHSIMGMHTAVEQDGYVVSRRWL